MLHLGNLCRVIFIVILDFLLRIFQAVGSQLGMVDGGGGRLGAACQRPGFPGLAEEIEPALLVLDW